VADRREGQGSATVEVEGEICILHPRGRVELNGKAAGRATLRHGDLIQVGETVIYFSEDPLPEERGPGLDVGSAPDLPRGDVQARQRSYESFHSLMAGAGAGSAQERRLEVLYRVSSAIYDADDLRAFLGRVLEVLFEALPVEEGHILLLSPDGATLETAAVQGIPRGKQARFSRSVIKEAFRTRESILCVDLRTDQRFKKKRSVRLLKSRSLMCAPLLSGEEVLGVIQVSASHLDHTCTQEDLDLLTGVALITSMAIQKVRLDQRTRRFSQALIILSQVSREISAHLERGPIIRESLLAAIRLVGAARGSFMVLEEDGEDLRAAHAVGKPGGSARIAREAIRTGKPVEEGGASTTLAVPVLTPPHRGETRGEVVGALALRDKLDGGPFTENDREILRILANQVGISLANADLHERATVDGLTRLYVRRFFFVKLEEEAKFHGRKGMPLSLLMIDVDRFKGINDAHGHPAGDHVLQEISMAIRGSLRPEDVPGRYGGEEFSVILPGVTLREASRIGERIRAQVESLPVMWGEREIRTTVSIGASDLLPKESPASLLARADRALYRAKDAGRNRVEIEG
jgi:diguanylate cyclase (GGDEF)-like protein